MQRLPFGQTSHIVKTCVVHHSSAAVALQATSGLMLTLENEHIQPSPTEQIGTDQTAQTASYDNYVIHLHL